MRGLIDYTIRSNIRNVTDLTVSIEAAALSERVTTFIVNSNNLATPQKLHVRVYNFCLYKTMGVSY